MIVLQPPAFKGKNVGVINGYTYPDSIKDFKGLVKEVVPFSKSNIKKLAANRIDVFFDDPVWAEIESKKSGVKIKILEPLVDHANSYFALSSKHKDLAAKIETSAKDLITKGKLDELYKKYVGISFGDFQKKYNLK